jgi:signal transduction histidine kinase
MADRQNVILIVDDNPVNLKVLSECLKETGHRVLVASTGAAALDTVQSISPDLILLDVMMPGMNGFELYSHLKALEPTQDIPIIFISALSDSIDKVKGLELGAVDYISKPFQQEEVLARVDIQLRVRRLTQELEQQVEEHSADLKLALDQLQQSHLQMVQSEKMSTLGQLVAGVAHEINNPVGFISGNLVHAKDYIQALIDHLQLYRSQADATEIAHHESRIDLDYLLEDLPRLLNSMEEGVERIGNLSVSLRTFSRSDNVTPILSDLHEGIESTLMILKHRLKATADRPEITVIKDYGDLPEVECFPGQLNQVFMNLLANAIDAIEEASQGKSFAELEVQPNYIRIQTHLSPDGQQVVIRILDNGVGIPEARQEQVFDQLFTTKPVGKGTGLGLTIARQIVAERHQGQIQLHSQPGQETEFVVTLPLHVAQTDSSL